MGAAVALPAIALPAAAIEFGPKRSQAAACAADTPTATLAWNVAGVAVLAGVDRRIPDETRAAAELLVVHGDRDTNVSPAAAGVVFGQHCGDRKRQVWTNASRSEPFKGAA